MDRVLAREALFQAAAIGAALGHKETMEELLVQAGMNREVVTYLLSRRKVDAGDSVRFNIG